MSSDPGLWKMKQQAALLASRRGEARGVWEDSRSRDVELRHLSPHESGAAGMCSTLEALEGQCTSVHEAHAAVSSRAGSAAGASQVVHSGLADAATEVSEAYDAMSKAESGEASARELLRQVAADLDAASCACAASPSEIGSIQPAGTPPVLPPGHKALLTLLSDGFGIYAAGAPGLPGFFDVIVHGDGDATLFGRSPDGPALTPAQLVAEIRSNPLYTGGPVRLIACHAGKPGGTSAQEVADRLGQPVLASTSTAWATSHGHLFSGASDANPNGRWVTFYPRSGS